ncbi:MAG: alkaline phosphatase family protein [Actinomycetota bacterium]|nr:alkaline phosphatase family protein [Actinomycetota bacterium]
MPGRSSFLRRLLPFAAAILAAAITTFRYGLLLGLIVGAVGAVIAWAAMLAASRAEPREDPSRRRFLALSGLVGLVVALSGAEAGRLIRRWTRANPDPVIQDMARGLGSEALTYLRRGHYPEHSGELQLVVAPFSSSNYPQESTSLVHRDPRTSHAAIWPYLERVPVVVHAPGILKNTGTMDDRVTLADLAPTASNLMGFDFAAPDGMPLPGVPRPSKPPKVIVMFVIDGGGWNVLRHWSPENGNPVSWPKLRAIMESPESLVYRNAVMGSFPSVTACAHATIGTGAFPWKHGISPSTAHAGKLLRIPQVALAGARLLVASYCSVIKQLALTIGCPLGCAEIASAPFSRPSPSSRRHPSRKASPSRRVRIACGAVQPRLAADTLFMSH